MGVFGGWRPTANNFPISRRPPVIAPAWLKRKKKQSKDSEVGAHYGPHEPVTSHFKCNSCFWFGRWCKNNLSQFFIEMWSASLGCHLWGLASRFSRFGTSETSWETILQPGFSTSETPWGAILQPWDHLKGPWE